MSDHRGLYPPVEPHDQGFLDVGNQHRVYWEVSGNPTGKPAVFVHGGPGGGTDADNRRYWDPNVYRIVLFDQRGCGKSTPYASLEHNTTWDLIGDMELLRAKLGIDRWQVFGGSWGSTLSLAYAQRHPERVTELVLRGIFLMRAREIDWYYQEGASRIYPDAWEAFLAPIPEDERDALVNAYHRRLTGDDPELRVRAAQAWSVWEGSTSTLLGDPKLVAKTGDAHFAEAFARIECHYFVNRGFFERNDQLLEDMTKIEHIPGVIVHGRYDVVCTLENAWALHKRWPNADLRIVQGAGHSSMEPGIARELVQATDRFRPE
ncbi:MAG: prolyl aminopeptidase [Myxococcota bacterium]